MGYKEEYEQEIDLKDLMFHVLYRWRPMLLVAVLACALAAGYAALYNGLVLPDRRAGVQAQLEEQERLLGALEEGQPADTLQRRLEELQGELDGLDGTSIVKNGAIGLALGLFGLAFCYAVGYVLSDRMRGERELLDRYGYRLLGTFPRRRKGKALQGFDRSLEEWEGGSGPMEEEEVLGIIAMNITNLAPDGGLFLVTGTVDAEKLQKLTKGIVPLLQKNVMLAVGADMNRTAGTLEMLGECDAVILVEERGVSLRGRIQREHESIAALGKPVVGYVVL
ncbi:MAG: hypothetical protein K2O45_16350 [Oscillospiraceae bacterium]|nr:hypothetical protein [Oscillospiraceae bacterium]